MRRRYLPINFMQTQINTVNETNELRLYDRCQEVRKYKRNACCNYRITECAAKILHSFNVCHN